MKPIRRSTSPIRIVEPAQGDTGAPPDPAGEAGRDPAYSAAAEVEHEQEGVDVEPEDEDAGVDGPRPDDARPAPSPWSSPRRPAHPPASQHRPPHQQPAGGQQANDFAARALACSQAFRAAEPGTEVLVCNRAGYVTSFVLPGPAAFPQALLEHVTEAGEYALQFVDPSTGAQAFDEDDDSDGVYWTPPLPASAFQRQRPNPLPNGAPSPHQAWASPPTAAPAPPAPPAAGPSRDPLIAVLLEGQRQTQDALAQLAGAVTALAQRQQQPTTPAAPAVDPMDYATRFVQQATSMGMSFDRGGGGGDAPDPSAQMMAGAVDKLATTVSNVANMLVGNWVNGKAIDKAIEAKGKGVDVAVTQSIAGAGAGAPGQAG